jgi:CheY-like chemotaxis protein
MKTLSKLSLLGLVSCLLLATVSFSSTELLIYLYVATFLGAASGYLLRHLHHPQPDMKTHSKVSESTVLLVDDEDDFLETIEFEFKKRGISVIKASNAHDALAIVAKKNVSVVVSDISMPGMGGFDLAREIKSHMANPPTVFLMTGKVDLSQEKAVEAGARAMLTKFHFENSLIDTVKTELDSRNASL